MSDSDRVDIKPGDVLAGKYRVERVLGAGGMGVVVAAHHLQLDERVALKFLLPGAVQSAEAISRFVREARAAVKIKSEHVARVTDVGELENGSPYMVMEYLEGTDLADRLETVGPLPVAQAVDFVLQTCEALADAHSLGIVHRDLKPANLFCIERSDGQLSIKVLDFGISKITTPGAPGFDMTRTQAVMGTPPYMSPEQLKRTKGVDARTDIWSLGVILFELLTGRLPFDAEAVTELAIMVANEPPPPLRDLRPDAPPGLAQVIATCLEKDPGRRFQSVGELAVALKDFGSKGARFSVERVLGTLRKAGISGAVLPPSGEHRATLGHAPTVTHRAPVTATSWGETGAGTTSRRAAVGVAVALVLGGIVVAVARTSRETSRDAGSSAAVGAPVTPPRSAPEPPPASAPLPPSGVSSGMPTVDVSSLPLVPSPSPAPSPAAAAPLPGKPGARPPHPPGVALNGAGLPSSSARPAPAPPAAEKPSCNPAYVIDSAGHRQYKPECLN